MTELKKTLQPLQSALQWFQGTEFGTENGYRIEPTLWQDFHERGLWHVVPLCAVQSWEDLPGLQPSFLCLCIDLRFSASQWPLVMVDPYRQCTTLASSPGNLTLALLNFQLASNPNFPAEWEQTRELWKDLHGRVGGTPESFDEIEQHMGQGTQILLANTGIDQQAARIFQQLQSDQVKSDSLVDDTSPWVGALNSRILSLSASRDIEDGGMGYWGRERLSRAVELLKVPAPYDINTDFPPLMASSIPSAWYYLFNSIRSNLLHEPDFAVPEGYTKLIDHGAEQGLSGLQHFELAARESSVQNDQVTAFHHLISAAYWALENTQTALPEAHTMALKVAALQGNSDAVEALQKQ